MLSKRTAFVVLDFVLSVCYLNRLPWFILPHNILVLSVADECYSRDALNLISTFLFYVLYWGGGGGGYAFSFINFYQCVLNIMSRIAKQYINNIFFFCFAILVIILKIIIIINK